MRSACLRLTPRFASAPASRLRAGPGRPRSSGSSAEEGARVSQSSRLSTVAGALAAGATAVGATPPGLGGGAFSGVFPIASILFKSSVAPGAGANGGPDVAAGEGEACCARAAGGGVAPMFSMRFKSVVPGLGDGRRGGLPPLTNQGTGRVAGSGFRAEATDAVVVGTPVEPKALPFIAFVESFFEGVSGCALNTMFTTVFDRVSVELLPVPTNHTLRTRCARSEGGKRQGLRIHARDPGHRQHQQRRTSGLVLTSLTPGAQVPTSLHLAPTPPGWRPPPAQGPQPSLGLPVPFSKAYSKGGTVPAGGVGPPPPNRHLTYRFRWDQFPCMDYTNAMYIQLSLESNTYSVLLQCGTATQDHRASFRPGGPAGPNTCTTTMHAAHSAGASHIGWAPAP